MAYEGFAVEEVLRITRIFSYFWKHYESAYRFEGELHNFWECVLVRRGKICVSADERIYYLSEREMIFHKPMELHKFNIESSEGADLFIFSFSLEGDAAELLKNKVYKLDDAQYGTAEKMIAFMEHLLNGESGFISSDNKLKYVANLPVSLQRLSLKITELFLSLLESDNVSASYEGYEASNFKLAVDFMNSNLQKNISVEELAEECRLSVSGIKRLFKKYTGIGVHSYFLALKIKTATELLQSGVTVTETAAKLGFSSQSYFSATYKRETGLNPTEMLYKG